MSRVRILTSAALAAATAVSLGVGAADAQTVTPGSVTDSLAGGIASSGIPAGSLAGNSCVGVEPGSGLPLHAETTVTTASPGVAHFAVAVVATLGPTNVDFTLRWTGAGGTKGEVRGTTQSTTGGSYASVDQPTGAGPVTWELTGLVARNTAGIGVPDTHMTSCSGTGTVA